MIIHIHVPSASMYYSRIHVSLSLCMYDLTYPCIQHFYFYRQHINHITPCSSYIQSISKSCPPLTFVALSSYFLFYVATKTLHDYPGAIKNTYFFKILLSWQQQILITVSDDVINSNMLLRYSGFILVCGLAGFPQFGKKCPIIFTLPHQIRCNKLYPRISTIF